MIAGVAITHHQSLQCGGGSSQSESELEIPIHQQAEEGKNDSSTSPIDEDGGPNEAASNDDSSASEKVFYNIQRKIALQRLILA